MAERYAFDATVSMITTVRFLDGSTRSLTLTYFQATTGQLFLAPSLNATTNATLTSGTISSLTSTGIATTGGTTINQGGAYSDGLTIARPNVALTVTCFAAGTMITTPDGPRAVETLRPGDLVVTRDRGPQPLRWIGRQSVDDLHARERERLRPIRIRCGALGDGAPSSDLLVSPQHRILVRSTIARRMFGTDEILVAAKHLLAVNGFEVADDLATVTYVHLMFDQHEIVISNGAETESLFTGPEALKALPPAAVDEIMTLFPELRDVGQQLAPARPLAPGRPARRLADRHAAHSKPLVA